MAGSETRDTIFALATAEGRAGVAVLRVSGPQAWAAAKRLCGTLPPPRQAGLRMVRDVAGDVIDEALVLTFPSGGSFTGEDVVEFQTHGSPAVVRRFLQVLRGQEALRLADPGEFTRRAFENGRLDLTQVEGLAGLIEAETEVQREQAMALYSGGLREALEAARAHFLRALAFCEAGIDFADEELPEDVTAPAAEAVATGISMLRNQLAGHEGARRIADGFEVAIVGPPNAGKSTLLNAIAGDEVAIVTEVAGTTRDVIECRIDLAGLPVRFLDTAGLRETEDVAEKEGVRRAEHRSARADLRVFLSEDGSAGDSVLWQDGDLNLWSKGDVTGVYESISAKTGEGIDAFLREVRQRLSQLTGKPSLVTSERQFSLIYQAVSHGEAAMSVLDNGRGDELVAEEIRAVLRSLEQVVGRVGVEDVLGEIFASFCIGK